MSVRSKREKEKRLVTQMIALYCHKKHQTSQGLCEACQSLDDYARSRIDNCRQMETKTFCFSCQTHCYQPLMRDKIRQVMRFSGPRMLLHHPLAALRHALTRLPSSDSIIRMFGK